MTFNFLKAFFVHGYREVKCGTQQTCKIKKLFIFMTCLLLEAKTDKQNEKDCTVQKH